MPVRLAELLLAKKTISPEQLQAALDHQNANGGKLSKAIVSLGFLKDGEIPKAVSRQYGVPSLDLGHLEVDPAIIKIIPAETALKYQVLPLSCSGRTLTIAMADPTNVFAMDDIKFMTGYNVEPVVASESVLEDEINRFYGSTRSSEVRLHTRRARGHQVTKGSFLSADDIAIGLSEIDLDSLGLAEADVESLKTEEEEIDLGDLAKSADTSPIVKLANVLLVDSFKRGASDIHIEPYEKEFRVRFRIDGVLYNVMALPLTLREPLSQRIKFLAKLNPAQKRLPQDGHIKIRIELDDRSRAIRFRVSVRPTLWGETIVLRLLDRATLLLDMSQLGFEPRSLERFRAAIARPRGMVVVTGPRRSGKTNTLLAAAASLNRPDAHIMTVEDRVEFSVPGINHVQIDEHGGETAATALRSVRNTDADIILLDEIRDYETAKLAASLAEQGHLVLSTLYTSDAPSTVARLLNMGVDPYVVATAVNAILAQRLVRRICTNCKVDVTAEVPSEMLIDIGFAPAQIGTFPLMKGRGCATCNWTGYKGWLGLYEVMEMTEGIGDLVMIGATAVEIKREALQEGMLTLRKSGLEKIKSGMTTVEEVLRETVL